MSHAQWPSIGWVKAFDTDETIRLGSYTPDVHEQFKNNTSTVYGGIYHYLYLHAAGSLGGTERIRCKIHGDTSYSSSIYTSSWASLSGIASPGSYWQGWVKTEFTSGHLNKNITYYLSLEIGNYTRNGTTFFIALKFDYPNPVYGLSTDLLSTKAYAFKPYTYKARVA